MRMLWRYNWHELLLIGLIALGETAAVALWLPIIAGASGHGTLTPWPGGLLIVGLAAYWLARQRTGGRFTDLSTRTTLGIWIALLAGWFLLSGGRSFQLATLLGAWTVVLAAVIAWTRGTAQGGRDDLLSPDRAHRLLGIGILSIGSALLISFTRHGDASDRALDTARWSAPLLVVSALLLSGLSVADVVESRTGNQQSRQRIGAVGLAAGLFLFAALLLILTGNAGFVVSAIRSVAYYVGFALFWAIALVAYAFLYISLGVMWLFGFHITFPRLPFHLTPPRQQVPPQGHAMPWWLQILLVIGTMYLTSLLARRYVRRLMRALRRRRQRHGVEVVRSSVHGEGSFADDLRGLFAGLRFGRRRAERIDLRAPPASVRDAYRKLLVLAALEGHRLNATESPRDFARRLALAWAELTEPVEDLTRRYVAARYGEVTSEADLTGARLAWERIRLYLMESPPDGGGRSPRT